MDQPPAVAFIAFTDAWPRAIETEMDAALCTIGRGETTMTFLTLSENAYLRAYPA